MENEQRSLSFRRSYWACTADLFPFVDAETRARALQRAREDRVWKPIIEIIERMRERAKHAPLGLISFAEADLIAKAAAMAETLQRFESGRPTMGESGDEKNLYEDIRRKHFDLVVTHRRKAEGLALDANEVSDEAERLRGRVKAVAGALEVEFAAFPGIPGAPRDPDDLSRVEGFVKSYDTVCNYLDALLVAAGSPRRTG